MICLWKETRIFLRLCHFCSPTPFKNVPLRHKLYHSFFFFPLSFHSPLLSLAFWVALIIMLQIGEGMMIVGANRCSTSEFSVRRFFCSERRERERKRFLYCLFNWNTDYSWCIHCITFLSHLRFSPSSFLCLFPLFILFLNSNWITEIR